ncbi:tyrosine-type recombinase/integrase [Quadrisphaera sp. KR29]|uniref:tyrosine-type recombinase/integrase n=1 Tax=Quadrisphaera sp. KR29 TaxID=3461391 RepID=UPI004044828A
MIDLGLDGTGRRRQRFKSGFPTKAAAAAALRELRETLDGGVHVSDTTLGEYLDRWLQGKHKLRPSSRAAYESHIKLYLKPHLGHVQLLELRAHHLDRLYTSISTGVSGAPLSASTVRRVHATLRSALNSAVKRRLLPHNPAVQVELPAESPKRPEPWTVQECLTFLDSARSDRLYAMYHLYLLTGLRRGEGVGLRWGSVNLDRRTISVTEQITTVANRSQTGAPKTRSGVRRVRLDETTVELLRQHRETQLAERAFWEQPDEGNGLVFTREDGSPLLPDYVTKHFYVLTRRAGLRRVRLHDLRHTSASLALEAGVAMKVVSDRLGHSSIAITANLYTHVYDSVALDGADRLAALLGASSRADVGEMLASEPAGGAL